MSRNEQKEDKIRDYLVFPNEKGTHTGMCAYNFTVRWKAFERTHSKQVQKATKSVFSQRKSQYNLNVKFKKLRQFKENQFSIGTTYTEGSSSEQERKVNALASGADEGRDKLR